MGGRSSRSRASPLAQFAALALLVERGFAGQCLPNLGTDAPTHFTNTMSLKANEAEGLRGLLRMSSVAGLSAAVASTTTLCCAQLASSASWSVVGMSSDLGTCQAYGLTTAPCVLRHSSKLLFTADSQFPVACTGDDGDITTIKLAGASLAGALPASLKGGSPDNSGGSFSSLSRLDLSSNSLTNISPAQLGTLSTLQEIDLSSALLTAVNNVAMHDILALLMAIGQQASNGLRIITITSNHLAGHFPPNFASSMQHLTTLDLAGNKMSAAIPDFSLSASSLQKLHLQNNLLTGTIPAGIFSLSGGSSPSLQEVWLQSNQLTGTLPNFVAASSGTHQLRSFKLDDNVGISGTIPGNINVATELHTLLIGSEDASKMQMHLSGTIPAGANQLKWRELGLSRNKLSGSFPTNMFANAPAELAKVHLAYNRLTGELPNMLTSCPLSTLPSVSGLSSPSPVSVLCFVFCVLCSVFCVLCSVFCVLLRARACVSRRCWAEGDACGLCHDI
jgi:Leucine-rich repeat (LRR) protein